MQDQLALHAEISAELGFASFQRIEAGTYQSIGRLPDWWAAIGADTSGSQEFQPSADHPFLLSFLDEAEDHWRTDRAVSSRRCSGICELEFEGRPLYVQLFALKLDDVDLLTFQNVETTGPGFQAQLQAGRNSQLELIRDMARRQQLEIELRQAHQNAQRLSEARTALLANVSHELRTPLTSILGTLELLQETLERDEQVEFGNTIARSAHSLLRLINDVLDVSKYEMGTVDLECSEICLVDLAANLRDDFHKAATQKGIKFTATVESTAPKVVWQDALRLRQILNNLIDNAIRFTHNGQVTVTIDSDHERDGNWLLDVEDTGIGIPRDRHELIFDSFTQVDASHSREYSGTGLGLAIANKLVRLLGGDLFLKSEVGVGSRFTVSLPITAVLERELSANVVSAELLPESRSSDQDSSSLAGIQVLVAEDNLVNRRYIKHVIEKADANVLEAADGRQVMDLLSEHDVDLVIMDCQMPVLDGLAVTAAIRAAEQRVGGHLPIVAVTAHTMQQDIEKCLAAGMDLHLAKPFKPAELRQRIMQALNQKLPSVAGELSRELSKQRS